MLFNALIVFLKQTTKDITILRPFLDRVAVTVGTRKCSTPKGSAPIIQKK